MKNKFLCLLLVLLLATTFVFAACQPNNGDNLPPDDGDANTPSDGSNEVIEGPSLKIHYKRTEGDYDKWGFWLWVDGGDGSLFKMNKTDEFGGVAHYALEDIGKDALTNGIGIIPRKLADWTKDVDADRMLDFSDYTPDADECYHVYIKEGDVNLYKTSVIPDTVKTAQFDNFTTLSLTATANLSKVVLLENDVEILSESLTTETKILKLALPEQVQIDLTKKYSVNVTFANGDNASLGVSITPLYKTKEFGDLYNYDGNDLGANYSAQSTTFKVWSPLSFSIVLKLFEQGTGGEVLQTVDMTLGEKGVWSATVDGDWAGKYYTYTVKNSKYPDGKQVVDPYAKSAGLNGVRGQIVDFSQTNPVGWENVTTPDYDGKQLVVWETHVADVTSSTTWNGTEAYRKKFLGMIQSGTTYSDGTTTVKTGFDHVKELGVNAIQLVPIFDQANNPEDNMKFNWGYNPLNYNVLEGGYSTDPTNGYVRINEFKQLVQAYSDANIGVIMDVVYNHTNSNVGDNFDVLMPGYYYRYTSSGASSNGSGCGNETASENYMFRKFMIESTCFWAEEYKLAGFRFDLMALHDVETMNMLVAALKQINPNIVVYGEPWTGGTTVCGETMASQSNANKFVDYGQFNDQMRDALIKGGMKGVTEKGWITGGKNSAADITSILEGLKGATSHATKDPNKTVNYATCHDNFTLYDRIKAAGITDEDTVKKMAMLANSVVLTSNGTTFILAGEEFLRTKGGDHNSYQSSYKVNELDYALKIQHYDMFQNYQKLIALKTSASGLCLNLEQITDENYKVERSSIGSVITITFVDSATNRQYKIVHANGTVATHEKADFDGYTLYLDTLNLNGLVLSAETAIQPYQTIIAYKNL